MTSRKPARFAAALHALAASCLMLSGCGGSSPDESAEAEGTRQSMQAPVEAPPSVFFDRSFVITDRAVLDKVAPDFKMGALLYAVNRYLTQEARLHPELGKKEHDPKAFALQPFKVGADDVDAHNKVLDTDPVAKVGTVPVIYNTFRNVILKEGSFDPDTGVEPFHLIAVVNRLDLAGDFDMRGGGELAGVERKWFGEARLVFSVDGTLPDGSPLPMTVIAEYRLPALKEDPNTGVISLDNDFKFANGPVDKADWRYRRQLWAQVWQDLSKSELNSSDYLSKLRTILSWTAYGTPFDRAQIQATTNAKNHLALRSGERVRVGVEKDGVPQQGALKNEFEYREFYLNDTWWLSTRKLRREPFACASASNTLAARITSEWWSSAASMLWRYTLGERNLEKDEVTDLKATCPGGKLPYGQKDDDGGGGTQLRAKFTRFKPETVWRVEGTTPALSEAQVHSFALGTCTGCHAAETKTGGFHIAPAPAGQPAQLSAFLSGVTGSKPRGTQEGYTYSYNEPDRRMKLVDRFAKGDEDMSDDLLLTDFDCKNVDVPCKVLQ